MKHLNLREVSAETTLTGTGDEGEVRVISGGMEPVAPIKIPKTCAYPVDLNNIGFAAGQIVTIDITNGAAVDLTLFLGTNLGIPGNIVGAGGDPATTANGDALVTDREGAGTPFINLFCQRCVGNPVIVTQLDILTADTPAGLAQRANRIFKINNNYNADPCTRAGRFRTFFTENNYVRTTDPIIVSDEWGMSIVIDAGEKIQLDLTLGALPIYNFGNPYTECV